MDYSALESKVQKSVDVLKGRSHISRLLIGLSGGKDSLCLCELVKMAEITNVRYFNMEFLPDLRIQRDLLEYACHRFNIPYEQIIKIPSEHFMKCMHFSAYTWYSEQAIKDFPNVSRTDVFKTIARCYKGSIVAGVKKCDSFTMRRYIKDNKGICLYPIADWTTEDVFTFMELRKIDIPAVAKKGCRGIGIDSKSLMFIYNNYPDDFKKMEHVLPFLKAEILKYKYFDIPINYFKAV